MNIHIIINKNIYSKFKDNIIILNPRLFCEPNFYSLENYQTPFDLQGISSYLKYNDIIELHSTSTFLDFINVLLVLSFLKSNNYEGKIIINYYVLYENDYKKARFINITLTKNDYTKVDELLNSFIRETKINNISLKIPGFLNYINFFNMLIDNEKFILSLNEVIEQYDEDVSLIASYLEEKYSNMGLNKEYYLKYLNKYL